MILFIIDVICFSVYAFIKKPYNDLFLKVAIKYLYEGTISVNLENFRF